VATTMTWAALDVHARSTQITSVDAATGELRRARMGGETAAIVDYLASLPQPLQACYEAGPTGFGLARAARRAGVELVVIAPTKTPRAAGLRIKTDRRDADHLVRQLMAGSLSPVRVPSEHEEAARDVMRDREQLRCDLMRGRHRLSKFLLRQGRLWPATETTWTLRHRAWLHAQHFDSCDLRFVYADLLHVCEALEARRRELDRLLADVARRETFWPTTRRLRCFRGVDTITALGLHLEIIDWHRFTKAKTVPAFFGLVPGLDQSGERATHLPITKTGSRYARRLLVEAAWHGTRPPRLGSTLRERQHGVEPAVCQIAWRCQRRLYQLSQRFAERGVNGNIANIARARELACFLWAAATYPP
jgi:transposase